MRCLSVVGTVGLAVYVAGQLHLPFEHRSLNPSLLVMYVRIYVGLCVNVC